MSDIIYSMIVARLTREFCSRETSRDPERHIESHCVSPFRAMATSGKGLKEGSVTLRYLGVLPSDGERGTGFSRGGRGTGG